MQLPTKSHLPPFDEPERLSRSCLSEHSETKEENSIKWDFPRLNEIFMLWYSEWYIALLNCKIHPSRYKRAFPKLCLVLSSSQALSYSYHIHRYKMRTKCINLWHVCHFSSPESREKGGKARENYKNFYNGKKIVLLEENIVIKAFSGNSDFPHH